MGRQGTVLGSGVLKGSPESRKRYVRIFAALLIVGVLAANVFAATITFTTTPTLGVGKATLTACDSDGFFVKPVTSWDGTNFIVGSLVLGGGSAASDLINTDCNGKTVKGLILDTASSQIGEIVTGAITGESDLTFALSAGVDASNVYGYAFEIAD